jgi:hypothetical protein
MKEVTSWTLLRPVPMDPKAGLVPVLSVSIVLLLLSLRSVMECQVWKAVSFQTLASLGKLHILTKIIYAMHVLVRNAVWVYTARKPCGCWKSACFHCFKNVKAHDTNTAPWINGSEYYAINKATELQKRVVVSVWGARHEWRNTHTHTHTHTYLRTCFV